uniref:hypothetical protein n=1 Tax=Flavobacterium sp. TaxID=239 RepID=UPI004049CBA5
MDAPKEILKELYWSFYQTFSDKEEFEKELIEYNTRLLKPKPQLNRIIYPENKIVIQFMVYQDSDDNESDYDEERQIFLETNNINGFTLSELMYQINNKVVENGEENIDISEQDAVFFEGLEYLTDDDPDYPQTKVYYMILGS